MNDQPLSSACQQTQEAILGLLDNECINDQEALLARHLPNCPDCQAYHESMQNLTLSLKTMEPVVLPAGLEQRILQTIALAHQGNTQRSHPQPEQERASDFSASQRKTSGSLGTKWAPIAATILTVALSLPLIYQALAPNAGDGLSAIFRQDHRQGQNLSPGSAENFQSDFNAQTLSNSMNTSMTLEQELPNLPNPQQSKRMADTQPLSAEQVPPNAASGSDEQTAQTEVALALPSAQSVGNTYASKHEGDIYFDPVSELVDF